MAHPTLLDVQSRSSPYKKPKPKDAKVTGKRPQDAEAAFHKKIYNRSK